MGGSWKKTPAPREKREKSDCQAKIDEVSQDVCACARIWETGPIPERPVDIHLARQVGQLRGSPLWKGMAGGQVQKMALERYDVVQWYWGG